MSSYILPSLLILLAVFGCQYGVNGLGEIIAECDPYNPVLPVDPLLFPGQPGASHMHQFFGCYGASENTTVKNLCYSGTSCRPALDGSLYWVPTLIQNGQHLPPSRTRFYYHSFFGFSQVQTFPRGFSMVARKYKWGCQGGSASGATAPTCGSGESLEVLVNYPDCWNGKDLISPPTYMTHVTYSKADKCPADFPVLIPRLQFKITYPTRGGPGITLSSGSTNTAHGDFINGWNDDAFRYRVIRCLRANQKCPISIPEDALITVSKSDPTDPANTPTDDYPPYVPDNSTYVDDDGFFDTQDIHNPGDGDEKRSWWDF